jgi:hypothetical protein
MIPEWLIIGILVFLALALIFKFQDVIFIFGLVKKYMFPITIIIVVLFFAFTFSHIHSNYDLSINSSKDVLKVGMVYFNWLKTAIGSGIEFTGNVINSDWAFFGNSTQGVG